MATLYFLVYTFVVARLHSYVIDFNKQDRLFYGTGALSAGASSRLLIDYEEPYRSQVLDYLFTPNFGANLQILKVEIGGDTWSTCGTEPSHMHTADDLNYKRGYEYWLMVEAKKRNPLIKFYALSWGFPSWIGPGALNENMANYTLLWVKGAKDVYNCNVDWIGIWNEDNWSPDYVKLLRKTLDANGYNNTRIVVADEAEGSAANIISAMQKDPEFANSFDAIGVHYPGASKDTVAMAESGKILWSSEDSSTNDNDVGGGCWARLLNWNYIYGNYTSTIMWAIISSWSEYLPYYGDGLMNAAWPWNGYYEVMSPLWMNAHTAQFVDVLNNDWYYVKTGYGSGSLVNGGTYVTFMSNDGQSNVLNVTIVIETMEYQNSLCIRSNPSDDWSVKTQNITFNLQNNDKTPYKLPTELYVWKSVLFGDNISWFEKQSNVQIGSDFSFTLVNVEPNAVITLTTISTGNKGSYLSPPAKAKFSLPYSDDFQSYADIVKNGGQPQPKYFSDQAGSFAVTQALKQTDGNYAFEQMVPFSPSDNHTGWHDQNAPQPLTIIGDYNLTDLTVNVSAYIISNNQMELSEDTASWNTSNIMVAVRLGGSLPQSGCRGAPREYPCVQAMGGNFFDYGYLLQINDNGYWKLMPGALNKILIDGDLNMDLRQVWFDVSLTIKGYTLSGTFNGKPLFDNVVDASKQFGSGWAALSCGWQTCQFDNFSMS